MYRYVWKLVVGSYSFSLIQSVSRLTFKRLRMEGKGERRREVKRGEGGGQKRRGRVRRGRNWGFFGGGLGTEMREVKKGRKE